MNDYQLIGLGDASTLHIQLIQETMKVHLRPGAETHTETTTQNILKLKSCQHHWLFPIGFLLERHAKTIEACNPLWSSIPTASPNLSSGSTWRCRARCFSHLAGCCRSWGRWTRRRTLETTSDTASSCKPSSLHPQHHGVCSRKTLTGNDKSPHPTVRSIHLLVPAAKKCGTHFSWPTQPP